MIVLKVTRLQLYVEVYTRKDKYEGRHPFLKGSSEYERRQQRCPTTKGTIIGKKNDSGNYNAKKEDDNGQVRHS